MRVDQPSAGRLHNTRFLPVIAVLLTVIVTALFLAFCFFASSLCITVLLAAFLSLLLSPIVTVLERLHVPKAISALFLVLAAACGVGGLVYATYGKAAALMDDIPEYSAKIRAALAPISKNIQKVQQGAGTLTPAPAPNTKRVQEVHINDQVAWPSYLVRGVGSAGGALLIIGAVPFLVFFMLATKDQLYLRFCATLGNYVDCALFICKVGQMVRSFVLGNLLIGAIMVSISIAVFSALKLDGALVVGILSGLLNLIPFLGAILAAIVPMVVALPQYDTAVPYVIICVTVILLHLVSANLLIPKLIGSRVNIGPVAATIGMLFWGWLWGVMGLLLAVPLTAFVKIVADSHPSLIHISNLLAENPRQVPAWAISGPARVAQAIPFLRRHPVNPKSEESGGHRQ